MEEGRFLIAGLGGWGQGLEGEVGSGEGLDGGY